MAVRAGEATRVDVTLSPGGTAVVGTISDAIGGPIEGAVVSAARRRGPLDQGQTSAATLTDRDGRYRLSLPPGSYGVAAEHDDYLRAATTIELAAAELTVDLRLVPGGVIEGVVKDVRVSVNASVSYGLFGWLGLESTAVRASVEVDDSLGRLELPVKLLSELLVRVAERFRPRVASEHAQTSLTPGSAWGSRPGPAARGGWRGCRWE